MVVHRLSLVNILVDTGSTPCITIANLNSPHSRFSNIVNDSEVTGTRSRNLCYRSVLIEGMGIL